MKQICGEAFRGEAQFSQSQDLSLPDIHVSAFRTVNAIRQTVEYAYLDGELFDILQNPQERSYLISSASDTAGIYCTKPRYPYLTLLKYRILMTRLFTDLAAYQIVLITDLVICSISEIIVLGHVKSVRSVESLYITWIHNKYSTALNSMYY